MSLCHALFSTTLRCLVLCLAMLTLPVQAKRVALVMGNDNYISVNKLQKAGNDAEAMARELKAAGFTVSLYKDLNFRAMLKAIESFSDAITGGDEVVVFYAGHGVQIKAGSYLLPVDIEAESESQVERTSYGLNDLTEKLAEAKPAFTLVMVDACRDNPMKVKGRAVGNARGLNALEPPKGQMVVYSASRGQQALDRLSDNDTNPNGVFTREFITRMRTPGVKIEDLMRDVQDSVESLAKTVRHEQRPAVYNEARGNFYFYGPTTVQVQQGGDDLEAQTWAAAQAANSVTAYQTYLDAYPKGKYVVVAKIKLDAIKQSSEKPSTDTEAGLWAEVKATGTREYLEAYIAQYPSGKYVVLARLELKKLDDAEKAKNAKLALEAQQAKQREEQQAQRVEQAVWDEAQKGNTASSYSVYLDKYPIGRFAVQAKAARLAIEERIAEAKRAEVERLKAELAKKAEQERIVAEAMKAAEERARAETAKKAEDDRLAAESKRVAEERAKAERVKRAEEERLAAEARKVEEQRTKEELEKYSNANFLAAEVKKAAEERLTAGLIKPDMVLIPAGSFMMGSKSATLFGADKNPEEKPQHLVKVPSFLMGKTEVTQGQWMSVMGSNPSRFTRCGDACPVENVSWNDAKEFIQKLNQSTGQNYRLPSEAEWEYAARAGTTSDWSFGSDEPQLGNYAWYSGNSVDQTHIVGQKKPNAFGLYDMHGNVGEWVEDCRHETYVAAPTDGSAWTTACTGDNHMQRGGSWINSPASLRSAYRYKFNADWRNSLSGFRLAIDWNNQASSVTKNSADERLVTEARQAEEQRSKTQLIKDPEKDRRTAAANKVAGQPMAVGPIKPDMVVIPAGSFMMGSKSTSLFITDKNPEEKPQHLVKVPNFLMGRTEVTQGQWKLVMGGNPSYFSACGDACPVENVSWNDVQDFIRKLNQLTGENYRLPSEAEWEHAARAGSATEWNFGNDDSLLGSYAWHAKNSVGQTHPVGQKMPNSFGLYDLYGNTWEWVEDCWHTNYVGAPTDGGAWTNACSESWRVLRGGSWVDSPTDLRSAIRVRNYPYYRDSSLGFRLASDFIANAPGIVKQPEEERPAPEAKKVAGQPVAAGLIKPDMVVIPAGSFMMGSSKAADEKPAHLVNVRSFQIGKAEVTQGQWKSVMGSTPSGFNACGDSCPVEQVSWNDAQDFIRKLKQVTGQNYRLPTEAEWEYASRAGAAADWSFGNDESKLGNYAWYKDNSGGRTHEVGQKLPNAFGLFDMHGNAWEWVEDCFHNNYSDAPKDATAWSTNCDGNFKVLRGGSWQVASAVTRSGIRYSFAPDSTDNHVGFRVALDLTERGEQIQKVKTSLKLIKDCFSCPEMVYLAGGDFDMGSNLQPKEMPVHKVSIASFYIGKTEITQAQWQDVMGGNPSRFRGFGSNWPVESISWDDAQLYVQRLSKKTGKSYRLLSEAEWEFAARGEDTGRWNFGDNEQKLFDFAWVGPNSKGTTQAVAQKKPNEFGLYDMYGNVEEWVADCYHDAYVEAPQNSSPWLKDCKGEYRVRRGGSWAVDAGEARSTSRDFATPGLTRNYLGLRVARDP